MSNPNAFGEYDPDKAGQRFAKLKINSVKADQSNIFRVLPPFGSLSKDNKISNYWSLHYGFVKTKNNKSIPIACIAEYKYENKKKILVKPCPLCDKVVAMQNALTALQARPDGQAAAIALAAQLKEVTNYGKPTQNQHYLNVLTKDGAVEILRISHKHFLALEAALKFIKQKYGILATSINHGLYLDFRKSGKGNETSFTVTPYEITDKDQNGAFRNTLVEHKPTPTDIERISREAKDLTKLYRYFSAEDLVLVSRGDETVIKRLFSAPVDAEDSEDGEEDGGETGKTVNNIVAEAMVGYMQQNAPTTSASPAPAPAPAPAFAPASTPAAAPMQATSAPMQAGTTAMAQTPPTQQPAPAFQMPTGNMSVDEIIARFSNGGSSPKV